MTNMTHCSECGTEFSGQQDVEFVDLGAESNFFQASKRFYLVACNHCGAAIGGGVAGR
jgi:predicted nucleic-acid-binding Zn-ribbon protein